MSMLGQIRITNKLTIVLVTNLVLLVAMGLLAYFSSMNIQGQLNGVFNHDFQGATFLLEADRDLHQALIAERSICFAQPGSDTFKAQLKDYADNVGQADARIEKCYQAVPSPETKKLVDAYFAARKVWEPISKQVIELASRGDQAAAQELSLGEAKASFDAMRDNIDQLTALVEGQAEEKAAASEESFDTLVTLLIAITLGSVLLGSIITFLISRNITIPLHKMVAFARAIAGGDYQASLDVRQKDENGILADAFREMLDKLKKNMEEVGRQTELAEDKARQAAEAQSEAEEAQARAERAMVEGRMRAAEQLEAIVARVSAASEQMSSQADEIRQGTDVQSQRIASTATAMEEMNSTVLEVARNSSETAAMGEEAKLKAQDGARVVEQSIEAMRTTQRQAEELKVNMDELGRQAEAIGQIMGVITDIADQTNLLALNAAIEAARAGEAGRGFAVVADEVRKLAEKTMGATKEVGDSIRAIQEVAQRNMTSMDRAVTDLNKAVDLSNQSSSVLAEIVDGVETSAQRIQSIATAAEEQSATSEEINQSVDEINRITQETAQGISETTVALRELADQMAELSGLIQSFKSED